MAKKVSGKACRSFPFPSERAYAKKIVELMRQFKWFTLFDGTHADATGEFVFCDLWKCIKQEGQWKCYRRRLKDMEWETVGAESMPRFCLWPIHRATSKGIMWSIISALENRIFDHVSSQFKSSDWDENNAWRGSLARKVIRKRIVNTIVNQGGGEVACKKMTRCIWESMLAGDQCGMLLSIHGNRRGFYFGDVLVLCQNEEVALQWKRKMPNAMPLLSRMNGAWVSPANAPHWLMKNSSLRPTVRTIKKAKEILSAPYSMLSSLDLSGSVAYWFLSEQTRQKLDMLRVRDRSTVAYRIARWYVHLDEFILLDRIVDFYCKTQYLLPTLPDRAGFRVYTKRFAPAEETWNSIQTLLRPFNRKSLERKVKLADLLENDAWMSVIDLEKNEWGLLQERYTSDRQAEDMRRKAMEIEASLNSLPAVPRKRL